MSKYECVKCGRTSEVVPLDNKCPFCDIEKGLSYDVIQIQINYFRGKILTIIDASISEPIQNKAIKDLIHGAFESKLEHFYRLCFEDGKAKKSTTTIK